MGQAILKVKITRMNTYYVVETPDGRVHMLNERALVWNLKNCFGFEPYEATVIKTAVNAEGTFTFDVRPNVAA